MQNAHHAENPVSYGCFIKQEQSSMIRITPLLCRVTLPVLVISLAGCGFTGGSSALNTGEVYDPGEPVNRGIFAVNQVVDDYVLSPVSRTYRDYVPQPVRRSVGNFTDNLGEPVTLVNDLLQGNVSRAWNTTQRFVINTTVGVVGLFDVGEDLNLPQHQSDFGQTLGVWGVGTGPAVQLPLLGPSNARDTAGRVLSFFANPLSSVPGETFDAINLGATGDAVIDGRANLLEATDVLQETSLDYYASLRSAEHQRRAKLVQDGIRGEVIRSVAPLQPPADPATPSVDGVVVP
jgi:phospholipid-binding lipoprotein MlaA